MSQDQLPMFAKNAEFLRPESAGDKWLHILLPLKPHAAQQVIHKFKEKKACIEEAITEVKTW